MTHDLIAAGRRLSAALAAENAALAALDIVRATGLLMEKTKAIDAFVAAQALARAGLPLGVSRAEAQALSEDLARLAAENKRLLDRALQVQKRVIRVIADAIPPPDAQRAPRYGARGHLAASRAAAPAYALSARV